MSDIIMPPATIAFLGLGRMGAPMANALVRAGFSVKGWTRSGQAAADHIGFTLVATATEAIADACLVIVCVQDGLVAEELLFGSGLSESLPPGAIVIDMGTSGIEIARSHAGRLDERGIGYLDAPVSGGVIGAEEASLSIFVGGTKADYLKAEAALRAMGRSYHLGAAGAGQAAKLANQIIVGVTIAAVAEGLAFAEHEGIRANTLLEALDGGFAGSRVLSVHGPRMAARDYSAGGAVRLHLKDLKLADGAYALDNLPHAQRVMQGFQMLADRQLSGLDHSAYAEVYRDDEESQ